MGIKVQSGDALIIVDLQIDFLPGGSLSVPRGDLVLAPINEIARLFHDKKMPIIATRDWHAKNHCSFSPQGGPWPLHCVAGTPGAQFSPALNLPPECIIISKGTSEKEEAYSGFQGTPLDKMLKGKKIRRVFIGGLATDYCVLNTVKDALARGYEVVLLRNAIQAVNVSPGDGERAVFEMKSLGAVSIDTGEIE